MYFARLHQVGRGVCKAACKMKLITCIDLFAGCFPSGFLLIHLLFGATVVRSIFLWDFSMGPSFRPKKTSSYESSGRYYQTVPPLSFSLLSCNFLFSFPCPCSLSLCLFLFYFKCSNHLII